MAGDAGHGIERGAGRVAAVRPAGGGKSRCCACRPGLPSPARGGGVSETLPLSGRLRWTCGIGSLIESACALKTDRNGSDLSYCNYVKNIIFWQIMTAPPSSTMSTRRPGSPTFSAGSREPRRTSSTNSFHGTGFRSRRSIKPHRPARARPIHPKRPRRSNSSHVPLRSSADGYVVEVVAICSLVAAWVAAWEAIRNRRVVARMLKHTGHGGVGPSEKITIKFSTPGGQKRQYDVFSGPDRRDRPTRQIIVGAPANRGAPTVLPMLK